MCGAASKPITLAEAGAYIHKGWRYVRDLLENHPGAPSYIDLPSPGDIDGDKRSAGWLVDEWEWRTWVYGNRRTGPKGPGPTASATATVVAIPVGLMSPSQLKAAAQAEKAA
jgi:hypothetical protein